ncbi:S9 family peptidase [Bacteroidota bacterium]
MKPYKLHKSILYQFLLILISITVLKAQSKIDIEWMYGMDAYQLSVSPFTQWTNNNTLLIVNNRNPRLQQKLELYNPVKKTTSDVINYDLAIKSLIRYLGDDTPGYIGTPDEIDPAGEKGLYYFAGDLYVLEFKSSAFQRITESPSDEFSARFSPDGFMLSYVRDKDLYYFDLRRNEEFRISNNGGDDILNGTLSWIYWEEIFGRNDIGYWWSEDSRAIAYLNTDESKVGSMIYVDTEPATPDISTQRYPKSGTANPKVRIGLYDLETNETNWADFNNHLHEYIIRVNWMPDDSHVSIQTMNRDQTQLDLFFVDKKNGKSEHILTETDPGWVNIHDDLYFLEHSNQFIWASERTGFMHLYLYDLSGNLVNQITSGDWTLASSSDAFWVRKSISHVDENNGHIYYLSLKNSSLEKHLYRINLDGKNPVQITQNEPGTHETSFSPDGRYYQDKYSDNHTPGSIKIRKTGSSRTEELFPPLTQLVDKSKIRFPEITYIPASDGFNMPATILKPANFNPARKYPVIISVYCGPSAPSVLNKWDYENYWNNVLADQGFIAVKVDNRSSTGISKKLENTILGNTPNEEAIDIIDAAKWLGEQEYVDKKRIGIWGWSGGGSMTLAVMTQSREFKAGIAIAPVSDWRYYDTKWAEAIMKTPKSNPDGYIATSHIRNAPDLHGRLCLVHGTFDDNVHIQNTYAFADMLIAAGITFDMMIYPGRDHGINDYPARVHLYKTMLEFWKKNL